MCCDIVVAIFIISFLNNLPYAIHIVLTHRTEMINLIRPISLKPDEIELDASGVKCSNAFIAVCLLKGIFCLRESS